MSIFGDKIRRTFGFPTEKEQLDNKINNYQLREKNNLEHSMALRNKAIACLKEQIRQLESIVNDNQSFIDLYNNIKNEAIKKTKMGDNPITSPFYDMNGKELINANYKTLNDIYDSMLKKNITFEEIQFYNNELMQILNNLWINYVENIIKYDGSFSYDNRFYDDYEIYTNYGLMLNNMKHGKLKNHQGNSIYFNETNSTLLTIIYDFCTQVNNVLNIPLSKLNSELAILNTRQANDEYYLNVIENAKKIMMTTDEYFRAAKNQEYLDEFGKRR